MRELKFRAWEKVNKEFAQSIYCLSDLSIGERAFVVDDDGDELIIEPYTGLKDKNGKEIYEGDIIRCYGDDRFIAPVIRHDKSGGFCWDSCYDEKCFIPESDEVEVIGNIHENPELLSGKEKQ